MSKQSSVQWLFRQLWDTPKDKFEWQSIFLMAHQMHQEEIVDAFGIGAHYKSTSLIGYHSMADEYYNETFGGQDERDRSIPE
jgi:hypothetical protein